jgi:hypothetical protein
MSPAYRLYFLIGDILIINFNCYETIKKFNESEEAYVEMW